MSAATDRLRATLPRPSLRRVAAAPLRPRTYGNLLYLALAFPLGLCYFVLLSVGLSLGVGFSFVGVGLLLLLALLAAVVGLATAERLMATYLLGTDIEAPEWRVLSGEEPLDRLKGLVLDPAVWTGLVFLATKLVVGVVAFTALFSLLLPAFVLVATPTFYRTPGTRVGVFLPADITRELSLYVPWNELLVGVSFVVRLTSWEVNTLPEALLVSLFGLVLLVLSLNVFNAAGWLCGRWARLLLGGDRPPVSRLIGRFRRG